MTRFTDKFIGRHAGKGTGRKLLSALLAIFIVLSLLPISVIADDSELYPFCGTEEHSHTEACYERVLTCGKAENEGGHTHTEDCYTLQPVLSCGLEENEAHTHTEACYTMQSVLICGLIECEPHVHTEACYEWVLTCGKEAHTHTLACYSDRTADVETPYHWQKSVSDAVLTGNWGHDVVEIAKTQLGYTESDRNYIVNENGKKQGYTRYGDWYGSGSYCYGAWCAGFVSFCLCYAGVEGVPYSFSVPAWVESLTEAGLYRKAAYYTPKPGDIVFFNYWQNKYGRPDHVGIVAEVTETSLITIEGNHTNYVAYFEYALDDPAILSFGEIPRNPNEIPQDRIAVKAETEFSRKKGRASVPGAAARTRK